MMHVDVGVYGHSKLPNFVGREKALRTFEKFTLEHKGYQALYAETLMPYEEFTEMFPRHLYDIVSISKEEQFKFAKSFLSGSEKVPRNLRSLPGCVRKSQ